MVCGKLVDGAKAHGGCGVSLSVVSFLVCYFKGNGALPQPLAWVVMLHIRIILMLHIFIHIIFISPRGQQTAICNQSRLIVIVFVL